MKFSRGGLFEDPIAFLATFEDGSQGFYRIPVKVPAYEFRIAGLEQIGNELLLSYPSLAGISYSIQSSDDPSSGLWLTIPGTSVFGMGGMVQQLIPGALLQPREFYRVKQGP